MKTVIVSACLLGIETRYDGTSEARTRDALALGPDDVLIPLCPEQLGGLPTPRPAAEIINGDGSDVISGRSRVTDENGSDVTGAFIKGAEEAVKIASLTNAKKAILKERSPSCAVTVITRKGRQVEGRGVTAALLLEKGIETEGVR